MGLTSIEWTATIGPDGTVHPGYTFNPWSGCTKISAGCANCYAAALPPRMRRGAEWGPEADRVSASNSYWLLPFAWNARAAKLGVRLKVFCASVSDVGEDRDDLNPLRDRLLALIALTPWLDWLLLTKRPATLSDYLADPKLYGRVLEAAERLRIGPDRKARKNVPNIGISDPADLAAHYPNLWVGASVENQKAADERIPHLLRIPASVRFLSCEPLLGPIVLDSTWLPSFRDPPLYSKRAARERNKWVGNGIGWIIAGGESGRKARPAHPDWARGLRDQCAAAEMPFLFKQWGCFVPSEIHTHPKGRQILPSGELVGVGDGETGFYSDAAEERGAVWMGHTDKLAAGRLLDGVEHNGFPEVK